MKKFALAAALLSSVVMFSASAQAQVAFFAKARTLILEEEPEDCPYVWSCSGSSEDVIQFPVSIVATSNPLSVSGTVAYGSAVYYNVDGGISQPVASGGGVSNFGYGASDPSGVPSIASVACDIARENAYDAFANTILSPVFNSVQLRPVVTLRNNGITRLITCPAQ